MSFTDDLSIGLTAEKLLLSLIKPKYPSATIIDKFYGYDIWIPETKQSIEVKCDNMCDSTGNIIIEIEINDKPSGIFKTEADLWAIKAKDEFLIIQPKEILYLILKHKLTYTNYLGNGGKTPSKAILIPYHLFREASKIIGQKPK